MGASEAAEATAGTSSRVLTLPNGITAVRLACIPLFVWLLFGAHRQTWAAILLAVLGATDWLDGYLARRLGQVSTLGKVLDPVADRVLVGTAVISIIVAGAVPVWFGVLTLAREALVALATLVLASLGARRIDVLWAGKAGTFGLMFAYPAFLLSHGTAAWQVPCHVFAWVAGGLGLALAWVAALLYLPEGRRALEEGRDEAGRTEAERGRGREGAGRGGDGPAGTDREGTQSAPTARPLGRVGRLLRYGPGVAG